MCFSQIAFSQSINSFIDTTIEVDDQNVPIDREQFYFPKEMFPEVSIDMIRVNDSTFKVKTEVIKDKYDDFVMKWYSKHLFAMKEPLLFNKKIDKEIYRFTWLRTFNEPVAVRIEKDNSEYKIYWKMLDGSGGYDPGKISVEKSKVITEKEWLVFIDLVQKSNFWKRELGRSAIGTDGSEWILEGVNQTDYKVVSVWSPQTGSFYEACNYLLSLTSLKVKERNKY